MSVIESDARRQSRPPAKGDGVLPGFPSARRMRGKAMVPGGLRRRWRDPDGIIYEWDYRHGTVELYEPRGVHRGELDPFTGRQLGPPI
ncbi:MAG: colicin E3/pyocin S6 family cytotoxin [Stellaceae bacterium]